MLAAAKCQALAMPAGGKGFCLGKRDRLEGGKKKRRRRRREKKDKIFLKTTVHRSVYFSIV